VSQPVDIALLAALGLAALVGHLALLVLARSINIVFVACAAFLVISPLSVALDLGVGISILKWVRVYSSLLMVAVYFLTLRTFRLGPAGWALLLFVGFYTLAGIWSPNPASAIAFKGTYAIVVLGGILLAASIRDFTELRVDLRILFVGSIVYCAFVLAGMAREPGAIFSGRLQIWGWNSNRTGHDAAAMLALALFIGLYERSRLWKFAGLCLTIFFAFVVVATGSRAAAGMAVISAVVLAAPLFRRPVLLTFIALTGGILVNVILETVSAFAVERLGEVDFSNRFSLWNFGLQHFYDNPLIGAGWVFDARERAGGATANLHSIYIQILAETGLVGAALFLAMLVICGMRALVLLNIIRKAPGTAPYAFFAFALAGATLAHGAAESSTLQGTNLNGLLLPFAVGLLDRLPQMIREAGAAQAEADEEYAIDADGEYIPYGEDPEPA